MEKESPVQMWPDKIKLDVSLTSSVKPNYSSLVKTLSLLIQYAKP